VVWPPIYSGRGCGDMSAGPVSRGGCLFDVICSLQWMRGGCVVCRNRDLTAFFGAMDKFVKRSRELREDSLNTSLDAG